MGNQKKMERAKKNLSLPTPPLKKSALNFSPVEVEILLRQLDEQRHILTGRVANGGPLSASHIRQAWNKVAKEVSEVSSVARSGSDVRQKWIDLKQRTRQKLARNEKRGSKMQPLTAVEEKVFSLIDVAQVLGIDGMEEGLNMDKVGAGKVRVEVSKLKEGIVKAMQNRKSSTAMDMDSTPPASLQDGSLSSSESDEDDCIESDSATTKATNGTRPSPKKASPPKSSLSVESSVTKKGATVAPKKVSSLAESIDAVVTADSSADDAASTQILSGPESVPLVEQLSVTNGTVVGNNRKRARMEEEVKETKEVVVVAAVQDGDAGSVAELERRRAKRSRQSRGARLKSQSVAQKLADTEIRRLEMERGFAERRLQMDRELAETRLAVERELLERRLMFDLDIQERKLRIEQDFCNRIAGGLNRVVDGLLYAYSSRQNVMCDPPRRGPAQKVPEVPQVEVPVEEVVTATVAAPAGEISAAAVPVEETAVPVDKVVTDLPEEAEGEVSIVLEREVPVPSPVAPPKEDPALVMLPVEDVPAESAKLMEEIAEDVVVPVQEDSVEGNAVTEEVVSDVNDSVAAELSRRSPSPEIMEVVEEDAEVAVEEATDEMFIVDLGIEEVTVETHTDEVGGGGGPGFESVGDVVELLSGVA